MSYRIRFTLPDGRTGLWNHDYPTREVAQRAIDDRLSDTGFAYTVEEVSEPGSTAAHHVEILRERVKELEAELAELKTSLAKAPNLPEPGSTAAHDVEILGEHVKDLMASQETMRRNLYLALSRGNAMHQAMTTAQSRFYVDWREIKVALAEWTAFKDSLAASPQGHAKASEEPREGGDSDRRRLEALERYLEGDTFREVWKTSMGRFAAGTKIEGQHFDAPTLAALADKLAEKEAKP